MKPTAGTARVVYVFAEQPQKKTLLYQLARQSYTGCSIYDFQTWSALVSQLTTAGDDDLPTLIAVDVISTRPEVVNVLSFLRNSRRLRSIPVCVLAPHQEVG